MKHVRLNVSTRSRLVAAIRKEAEKQWLDTPAVYKIDGRVIMGNGSAYDESDWLKDNRQEELAEWFHLRETFTCEINKLVQAWETLIGMHTTTRTLFEQHPELVRFAGIVKVTPPPADPAVAIAAAEATVAAFGTMA